MPLETGAPYRILMNGKLRQVGKAKGRWKGWRTRPHQVLVIRAHHSEGLCRTIGVLSPPPGEPGRTTLVVPVSARHPAELLLDGIRLV